jgi:hypothetical protein
MTRTARALAATAAAALIFTGANTVGTTYASAANCTTHPEICEETYVPAGTDHLPTTSGSAKVTTCILGWICW